MKSGAVISRDGRYRYTLTRDWWEPSMGTPKGATFIMLNPSTADADTDDPTIRRCIGYAKRWGLHRLCVVNIFAYRSTDPLELKRVRKRSGTLEVHGPENVDCITKCLQWELVGEFCASRQAREGGRDPYTEREQYIFRELSNINRKGTPNLAPGGQGQHPVENIVWLPAERLRHNYWNPNHVMTQELRLLERSLLRTNWVQPILINPDNLIIDGFHRVQLAMESEPLRRRDGGLVPCAILDVAEPEAMLITVRMNRAKGTHAAFRMSALVHALIDQHHYDPAQIATEIGATRAEVDLLYQEDVFAARKIADYRYSKAWVPAETRSCPARRSLASRNGAPPFSATVGSSSSTPSSGQRRRPSAPTISRWRTRAPPSSRLRRRWRARTGRP